MKKIGLLMVLTMMLLSSCLMPNDFVAEIEISDDDEIGLHYDGSLIHVMANSAYRTDSDANEVDDERLRKEADRILSLKEFRKSVYRQKGIFEVDAVEKIKMNGKSKVLPMLEASKNREGIYTVTVTKLTVDQKKLLSELDIDFRGKVRIKLPRNAVVLEHNANFEPWVFSNYYVWKLKSVSDLPLIRYTSLKTGL